MSYRSPYRQRARRGGQRIPAKVLPILQRTGGTYLGEDETYYYWSEPAPNNQLGGMFDNIGNMFKRMVKFTPKSFTPGNIYKGFVNTALTTATFGTYQLLPKHLKKTVYEVGKVAIPIVAGGVLAVTAGPAVMATLMPKLTAAGKLLGSGASALFGGKGGGESYGPPAPGESAPGVFSEGGTVDRTLAIGGELMNLLGRLPQNKQAEVVQRLTPEDIAYLERYQQIPPHLRGYFDQMARETFNPPVPSSGAASLYPGMGEPSDTPPVQAGLFGGMEPMTMALLIGVPALFFLMTKK